MIEKFLRRALPFAINAVAFLLAVITAAIVCLRPYPKATIEEYLLPRECVLWILASLVAAGAIAAWLAKRRPSLAVVGLIVSGVIVSCVQFCYGYQFFDEVYRPHLFNNREIVEMTRSSPNYSVRNYVGPLLALRNTLGGAHLSMRPRSRALLHEFEAKTFAQIKEITVAQFDERLGEKEFLSLLSNQEIQQRSFGDGQIFILPNQSKNYSVFTYGKNVILK